MIEFKARYITVSYYISILLDSIISSLMKIIIIGQYFSCKFYKSVKS